MLTGRGDLSLALDLIVYIEVIVYIDLIVCIEMDALFHLHILCFATKCYKQKKKIL